ncbi:hypothetical protein M662_12805 [Bacillus sp. SB49]|uniref:hypothetical protein n=1 Tax=Bacillus sp. SB49 TaxID=1071080 RepID=UPI000685B984|nr:hypothetical protein [Bacillus sp. SB49]QHT47329.1 hypothetical protein M662_12805 [Bacillus sp. SB49]
MGALSVPILIGFINVSATLPFLIAILIGTINILVNKKVLWNQEMKKYFKKTIRYSTFGYLALGFGFFAVRLIISGELNNFMLYCTLFYLAIGALYILALNKIYQKKTVQL